MVSKIREMTWVGHIVRLASPHSGAAAPNSWRNARWQPNTPYTARHKRRRLLLSHRTRKCVLDKDKIDRINSVLYWQWTFDPGPRTLLLRRWTLRNHMFQLMTARPLPGTNSSYCTMRWLKWNEWSPNSIEVASESWCVPLFRNYERTLDHIILSRECFCAPSVYIGTSSHTLSMMILFNACETRYQWYANIGSYGGKLFRYCPHSQSNCTCFSSNLIVCVAENPHPHARIQYCPQSRKILCRIL